MVPKGSAQEAVIRAAVAAAGLSPSSIGYVEASSVGTALGDPIEMEVLRKTLCENRTPDNPLFVGSVKTNIGHLEGASGVAALAKVVLSLERGLIPAHLHFEQPNPHVAWRDLPIRIPRETVPWPPGSQTRLAAISSFSISGANAHIILENAPRPEDRPTEVVRELVLPVSAKTESSLLQLCDRFAGGMAGATEQEYADICFTAATGTASWTWPS
jgi:acyl transferase domain-containing protein